LTAILVCGYMSIMNKTAHMFKALSDETRLRILCLLLEGELCVCDIMDVLLLPQSTVSRHLAFLKTAGLVVDRRCGVWMYYSLVEHGNDISRELLKYLRENRFDNEVVSADRDRLAGFCRPDRCL